MLVDSFFTYRYSLRFLLIHKLGYLNNTFNVPNMQKIFFFFNINKLEDIDEVQLYNNFYLFKFFLGKNAFFSKTKKYFSLGTWYYSFYVQLIIKSNKDIYLSLYLLFNNIFINIEKNMLKFGLLNKNLNLFFILAKDLNIYSELKTNLGLFNIKRPLNIRLFFSGCDYKASKILLNNLKFL